MDPFAIAHGSIQSNAIASNQRTLRYWSQRACCGGKVTRESAAARCRALPAPAHPSRHPLRHAHGAVQDAKAQAILAPQVDGFVGSELHNKLSRVYPYSDASASDIPQGSPDWLHARSKRVTASTVAKATGLLPAYVSWMQCSPCVPLPVQCPAYCISTHAITHCRCQNLNGWSPGFADSGELLRWSIHRRGLSCGWRCWVSLKSSQAIRRHDGAHYMRARLRVFFTALLSAMPTCIIVHLMYYEVLMHTGEAWSGLVHHQMASYCLLMARIATATILQMVTGVPTSTWGLPRASSKSSVRSSCTQSMWLTSCPPRPHPGPMLACCAHSQSPTPHTAPVEGFMCCMTGDGLFGDRPSDTVAIPKKAIVETLSHAGVESIRICPGQHTTSRRFKRTWLYMKQHMPT